MTTLHVASTSTRHYDFQGVGDTEHEARARLAAALRAHADADPWPGVEAFVDEIDDTVAQALVETLTTGCGYRDGRVISW